MTEGFLYSTRRTVALIGLTSMAACYNPNTKPEPMDNGITTRVSETHVDVSVGSQKRNCLLKFFYSKDSTGSFKTEPDSIALKSLSDCK